jgi:3-keto steroid reductase
VRFGSETGRWGDERIGLTEVKQWEKHKHEAEMLVDKCEKLFVSLRDAEGEALVFETATEHM